MSQQTTKPPTRKPQVTVEFKTGKPDPTRYRRLLEILFSPDPTHTDGLHTRAA